jgi:hypothetical protein
MIISLMKTKANLYWKSDFLDFSKWKKDIKNQAISKKYISRTN